MEDRVPTTNPRSNIVKQLALDALELQEDYHLYKLAIKLDTPDAKFHPSEDAWK